MQHSTARAAIQAILPADSFGNRAVCLSFAAVLSDFPGIPESLPARLLERGAAMPPDRSPNHVSAVTVAPIPKDQHGLCAQLAPVLIEYPAQTGSQIATLGALNALWPHASTQERPKLRQ